MFARNHHRGVAIAASSALIAVLLAGCATPPPPAPHGARVDIGYSTISVYDAEDDRVSHVSFDSVGRARAALISVLGRPLSQNKLKYGPFIRTEYVWDGLELLTYASKDESGSSISVTKPRVHGIPIVALHTYRIGGDFPGDGAVGPCAPQAMDLSWANLWSSMNPPRFNALHAPHGDQVVGFFEDEHRRGLVGYFEAPQSAQAC